MYVNTYTLEEFASFYSKCWGNVSRTCGFLKKGGLACFSKSEQVPEIIGPKQGWRQHGGLGGSSSTTILLAPRRHLNSHARSARHKIRELFLFFVFLGNTIGNCLQRFLDIAHCRHFENPSPQQLFSFDITDPK